MSKKPAPATALSTSAVQPAAAGGHPAAPDPASLNVLSKIPDIQAALDRFAPFIFCCDTDSRDFVDLRPVYTAIPRDPNINGNLFVVDRNDAVQWVAGLTDPLFSQLSADAKAQLPYVADGAGDPTVVAQCVRLRVCFFAAEKEHERIEEAEAAAQRHADLVERLMDDGMTKSEAEKAATEEEAAAALAAMPLNEDGTPAEPPRPQAFVLLKNFPATSEHCVMLHKAGTPLDAVVVVNSQAKFGRKEEAPPPIDPKAKGGAAAAAAAKKAEPKKADPKKGGKKGEEAAVVAPVESLGTQLRRDSLKLAANAPHKYDANPLSSIAVWSYDVPTAETAAVDETTGQKIHSPQESEAETCEKVVGQIVFLELAAYRYRTWARGRKVRVVPRVPGVAAAGSDGKRPQTTEGAGLAGTAPTAPAPATAAKAPAPAPKKGGKAAKEEPPPVAAEPPPPPPPPPLPRSMDDIDARSDLYARLADEATPLNRSVDVLLHCILDQVRESVESESAAATEAPTTTSAVAETIASKNRRDVGDFVDYVLAQLDGTQDQVFEAARKRRLKAAEMKADDGSPATVGGGAAGAMSRPLAGDEVARLMPTTDSTIDGDALLLGVPLKDIEGPIRNALFQHLLDGIAAVKVDVPSVETVDTGRKILKLLLQERCELHDADKVLQGRTHGELLSEGAFGERLAAVLRSLTGTEHIVRADCADGSGVLAIVQNTPSNDCHLRRWRSVWRTFQGFVSFPQYLALLRFADAENLFFHPPPKDDDDDDLAAQDAAGAGAGDEEDEDDEEVTYDEDGEPIVKKKEKKIVRLEPEFVPMEDNLLKDIRRRAVFELMMKKLGASVEADGPEWLLANNHTTNAVVEEDAVLFPHDGCQVEAAVLKANTQSTSCTVRTPAANAFFGFRAKVTPPVAAPAAPNAAAGSTPAANSATVVAGQPVAPPVAPLHGLAAAAAAHSAAGASVVSPNSARSTASAMHGGSKGGKIAALQPVESGVTAVVNLGPEACFTASCEAVPDTTAFDPDASSTSIADSHQGGANAAPLSGVPHRLETVVHCTTPGAVIGIHGDGRLHFTYETPRDSPVTVFNPLTQQITRIFTEEVSRWVLRDGTVLSTFADGTRMNMFPSGNTAVLHKDVWLLTSNTGRRTLKYTTEGVKQSAPAGTPIPTVVSLVTTNTDVETMSRVTTREDGVLTVHYDDGRQLVQHIDGTRMWMDAARSTVEVETEGLPVVFGVPAAPPPPSRLASRAGGERLASIPGTTVDDGLGATTTTGKAANQAMGFRSTAGLTVSVAAGIVSVQQASTGLQCAFDTTQRLCFVRPQPSTFPENVYTIDIAFGGLRAVDGAAAAVAHAPLSLHVTPFGRSKVRPLADDQPVPIVDTPGVRQVVEVFYAVERLDEKFCAAAVSAGIDVNLSLHAVSDIPLSPWGTALGGAAAAGGGGGLSLDSTTNSALLPPRSRQVRERERDIASAVRAVIPEKDKTPSAARAPYLFIIGPGRRHAIELTRRQDAALFADSVPAVATPLHSNVFQEASATTPGAQHLAVSLAAARPQVRKGIPKILLDLRAGGATTPLSVAHFLQELKNGPSGGNLSAKDDLGIGGASTIHSATRHWVVLDGSVPVRQLLAEASDAFYQRALAALKKAIPPVIAAQLGVVRQAHTLNAGRDNARSTSRTNARATSREARRSQLQKDAAAVASSNHADPDYQDSSAADAATPFGGSPTAAIAAANKTASGRGGAPRPNPIADLREQIARVAAEMNFGGGAAGGYWRSEVGAPHVAPCAQANEKYKAKNGYVRSTVPQFAAVVPTVGGPVKKRFKSVDSSDDESAAPTGVPPSAAAAQPTAATATPGTTQRPVAVPPVALSPSKPPAATGGSHAASTTGGASLMSSSAAGQRTTGLLRSTAPRLVATPQDLDFGRVSDGFRYASSVSLTNVGTAACRYLIRTDPAARWLKVSAPQVALAAGMSLAVDVEVDGSQPAGGRLESWFVAVFEGGDVRVPVIVETAANGRPTSSGGLRPGVRLLGPRPLPFAAGKTKRLVAPGSAIDVTNSLGLPNGPDSDDEPSLKSPKMAAASKTASVVVKR